MLDAPELVDIADWVDVVLAPVAVVPPTVLADKFVTVIAAPVGVTVLAAPVGVTELAAPVVLTTELLVGSVMDALLVGHGAKVVDVQEPYTGLDEMQPRYGPVCETTLGPA